MTEVTLKSTDLINITAAALELRVCRMTIYRWVKEGKILAVKFGKSTFIPKSEIERLKQKTSERKGTKERKGNKE